MARKHPDVFVSPHGTIWLFEPATRKARAWFDERVQAESWQWQGHALAVEHRFGADIARVLDSEGFKLAIG